MWARVTSLCTGYKVRDATQSESELNRKNRLDGQGVVEVWKKG